MSREVDSMLDAPGHQLAVSRRKLIASAGGLAASVAGGSAALAAPGSTSSAGRAVAAQDGGYEYHAAWGWLDPGAGGHFNSFVTNAILPPPSTIYGDLILAP